METSKINTDKKDNPIFAFLPEMVIEHINHSKSTEFKAIPSIKKNDLLSNATTSQNIIFEPLADPFDGVDIEILSSKKNNLVSNTTGLQNIVFDPLGDDPFDEINIGLKNDLTSNTTASQNIVFEPLADPFDGITIEILPSKKSKKEKKTKKKAQIKCVETVNAPVLETNTTETSGNKIIQFVKKMKLNF